MSFGNIAAPLILAVSIISDFQVISDFCLMMISDSRLLLISDILVISCCSLVGISKLLAHIQLTNYYPLVFFSISMIQKNINCSPCLVPLSLHEFSLFHNLFTFIKVYPLIVNSSLHTLDIFDIDKVYKLYSSFYFLILPSVLIFVALPRCSPIHGTSKLYWTPHSRFDYLLLRHL